MVALAGPLDLLNGLHGIAGAALRGRCANRSVLAERSNRSV
jgi:hypothetical protein